MHAVSQPARDLFEINCIGNRPLRRFDHHGCTGFGVDGEHNEAMTARKIIASA